MRDRRRDYLEFDYMVARASDQFVARVDWRLCRRSHRAGRLATWSSAQLRRASGSRRGPMAADSHVHFPSSDDWTDLGLPADGCDLLDFSKGQSFEDGRLLPETAVGLGRSLQFG